MAAGDRAHRRRDVLTGGALEDVAARSRLERREDGVIVIDHGHDEHGRSVGEASDAGGCRDAGHRGQVQVHQNDVNAAACDRVDCLLPVFGSRHDVAIGKRRQQGHQTVAEERVVVDHQHPCRH
jgi:hypothetical protein